MPLENKPLATEGNAVQNFSRLEPGFTDGDFIYLALLIGFRHFAYYTYFWYFR
jgi:hypothetical protein